MSNNSYMAKIRSFVDIMMGVKKPKKPESTSVGKVLSKDPTRDPKLLGANYKYKGFASNIEKTKKRKAASKKRKPTE